MPMPALPPGFKLEGAAPAAGMPPLPPGFRPENMAPGPPPDDNSFLHDLSTSAGSFVDALGRAIAVPGRPDLNVEHLADYLTSIGNGGAAHEAEESARSDQQMGEYPTGANVGALTGHALEAVAGSELASPLADAAAPEASAKAAVLRGMIRGGAGGAAAVPAHPVAGAASGAAGGAIIEPLVAPTAAALANQGQDWYKAGFRNATGNPVARDIADESGQTALKINNQKIGNVVAANEAGVPEGLGPTPYPQLAAGREAPNTVYNRLATALGPDNELAADPVLAQALENANGQNPLLTSSDANDAAIGKQVGRLLTPGLKASGNDIIDAVRALRQRGYSNMAMDGVPGAEEANTLGESQLRIANALDDWIDRNLPADAPVSLDQLKVARTALAKNQAVQTAARGSNVDLRAIAKMQRADPNLLTGGLKTIADFVNDNGEVVGTPQRVYSPPSYANDVLGTRGRLVPHTFFSPGFWTGLLGAKAAARGVLTGDEAANAEAASSMFPPRDDAQFAPISRPPPPKPRFGGLLPAPAKVNAGGGVTTDTGLNELGLTPDVQSAGPMHPGAPRVPAGTRSLFEDVLPERQADMLETPPAGFQGRPGAGPVARGPSGSATLLRSGQPRYEGLSLEPEDDAESAIRQMFPEGEPSYADLLTAMAPEEGGEPLIARGANGPDAVNARRRIVGSDGPFENNASGESVASLEGIRRPKLDLDEVDPSGRGSPILKDVTQVDRVPTPGNIFVNRSTGEIAHRGTLNAAQANGLRNRYLALRAMELALEPHIPF